MNNIFKTGISSAPDQLNLQICEAFYLANKDVVLGYDADLPYLRVISGITPEDLVLPDGYTCERCTDHISVYTRVAAVTIARHTA